MSQRTAIELAIARTGGLHAMGRALGIPWQTVQKWRKVGRIPPKHVIRVEKVSGIRREQLNPAIYPPG